MQAEDGLPHPLYRRELTAFLQACRRRLTPESVGLPAGGRRRVKGLRREEVALLAGISSTWYTWFEQGRSIQVSEATLEQIARVLQLDEAEHAYLSLLVAPARLPSPLKPLPLAAGDIHLQDLLDALDPHPALVRDQNWDIVAWNHAEAGLIPWSSITPEKRNILVYLFTHPHARQHLPQWEAYARHSVQVFHLTWGQSPPGERLVALLGFLRETSPEFDLWWQEQRMQQQPPLELVWRASDKKSVRYSILYMGFPLHPQWVMRVLFPQPTLSQAAEGASHTHLSQ